MPASVSETQDFTTTVQGPAGGDPRTAQSVRAMGTPLASRTKWLRGQQDKVFGTFQKVESVSAAGDTLTLTAHGLVNNNVVHVASVGGAVPSPLFANFALYVIKIDDDTIKLALTSGGGAIDLTDAGTGDIYVFRAAASLDALVHTSFSTLKGDVIPAGNARLTLAAYYMPTLGGAFVGEVTRSGDNATTVDRVGTFADSSVTLTIQTKDLWVCPDVTANRSNALNDPPKAGLRSRIVRTQIAGGFTMTILRGDASTVGVLATKCFLDVESYDAGDGLGLAWHGTGTASNLS